MTTPLSRLFARPRAFSRLKRKPLPTSQATFWWAYALDILAVVVLVRALT